MFVVICNYVKTFILGVFANLDEAKQAYADYLTGYRKGKFDRKFLGWFTTTGSVKEMEDDLDLNIRTGKVFRQTLIDNTSYFNDYFSFEIVEWVPGQKLEPEFSFENEPLNLKEALKGGVYRFNKARNYNYFNLLRQVLVGWGQKLKTAQKKENKTPKPKTFGFISYITSNQTKNSISLNDSVSKVLERRFLLAYENDIFNHKKIQTLLDDLEIGFEGNVSKLIKLIKADFDRSS